MNIQERKRACEIVEQMARDVGKDCEIIFLDGAVQVAPLGDSGYSDGDNLYEALTEALKI